MEKKTIMTLSALLAASLAGNVYLKSGEQVEIQTEPIGEVVEVVGSLKGELNAQFVNANAKSNIVCQRGVISNLPKETVYCTDGASAGWVLTHDQGSAVLGDEYDQASIYKGEDGSIKAVLVGKSDRAPSDDVAVGGGK